MSAKTTICPVCRARLVTDALPARGQVHECPRCGERFESARRVRRAYGAAPSASIPSSSSWSLIITLALFMTVPLWILGSLLVREGSSSKKAITPVAVAAKATPEPRPRPNRTPVAAVPDPIVPASTQPTSDEPEPDPEPSDLELMPPRREVVAPRVEPEVAGSDRGRELFVREWVPDDPRSHRGDGLGPVYNETSCAACHNLGGVGGGGSNSKNVDIITRISTGSRSSDEAAIELHPGFRRATSVVLHRFGNVPGYAAWRRLLLRSIQPNLVREPEVVFETLPALGTILRTDPPSSLENVPSRLIGGELDRHSMPAKEADVEIRLSRTMREPTVVPRMCGMSLCIASTRSRRNASALFGSGSIDAIPERAIEAGSRRAFPEFPTIRGRVSRLEDGRIGRFGWKAQTPTLREFVLTACSVELGLDVPDHPQARDPREPDVPPKGLDLTAEECDHLVAFVATLPAPGQQIPAMNILAAELRSGEAVFNSIGCTTCHTPNLGNIRGIYSDLLLHDMGPDGSDTGSYSSSRPQPPTSSDSSRPGPFAGKASGRQRIGSGARDREWRTPPLWGVRDSAPYLHDGRADTLDQAIALHGGQGMGPASRYFKLSPSDQQKVRAFLKSLVAPGILSPR
jgi:CxxC motif-containing protein (DUF1111 family)